MFQRTDEISKAGYGLPRSLLQPPHIAAERFRILHGHRLVRSPCREHPDFKTARLRGDVVLQAVHRVIGGTYRFHTVMTHQAPGRELRLCQLRITLLVNISGRRRVQQFVDTESRTQFQMRPMVQWVAQRIRHGLRPLLKLLPVRSVARDVTLVHPVGTHGTPLVMVTAQPQFRNGTEAVVLCHHPRIQMAMVIYDGQPFGMPVIQFPRGVRPEQEILIHKCFHVSCLLFFNQLVARHQEFDNHPTQQVSQRRYHKYYHITGFDTPEAQKLHLCFL